MLPEISSLYYHIFSKSASGSPFITMNDCFSTDTVGDVNYQKYKVNLTISLLQICATVAKVRFGFSRLQYLSYYY